MARGRAKVTVKERKKRGRLVVLSLEQKARRSALIYLRQVVRGVKDTHDGRMHAAMAILEGTR